MLVRWEDSYTSSGWDTVEGHRNDDIGIIHTLGWLVERTDTWIRVALQYDSQKVRKVSELVSIPAFAVRSVRRVRL